MKAAWSKKMVENKGTLTDGHSLRHEMDPEWSGREEE